VRKDGRFRDVVRDELTELHEQSVETIIIDDFLRSENEFRRLANGWSTASD